MSVFWTIWAILVIWLYTWCIILLWYLIDIFWNIVLFVFFGGTVILWILIYLFQKPLYNLFYDKNGVPNIPILPNRTYEEKIWTIKLTINRLNIFSKLRNIFFLNISLVLIFFYEKKDLIFILKFCLFFTSFTFIMHFYWKYLNKRKKDIENENFLKIK